MDVTWVCTACGKSKQLGGSHLTRKTSVTSDCWPCGRKRVFTQKQKPRGSGGGDGGTGGPLAAAMPRAASNNTEEAANRAGGTATPGTSPRTAPTSGTATFPGPTDGGTQNAAAAAFQAWATSKVGAGGPRPSVKGGGGGGGATTTTAPIPSAPGAFAVTTAASSSPEQRPSAGGSSVTVGRSSGGPFALPVTAARDDAPPPSTSAPAPQFRLPSPATGRSPRDSSQQHQGGQARTRSASTGGSGPLARTSGTLISGLTQDAASNSFASQLLSQQPPRWLCSGCGKEKNLSGPHLNGKTTVRSDCWPCGRKRVFELRQRQSQPSPAGAAAAAAAGMSVQQPSTESATEVATPTYDGRASQPTPPLVSSSFAGTAAPPAAAAAAAEAFAFNATTATSAGGATTADVDLDAYLRNVFTYLHRDLATQQARDISLRRCPAPEGATHPLPTLQLVERSELWSAGEGPASLARQASGSAGMGSRSTSAAADRADTFERLSAISARIGPALTRAAAARISSSGNGGGEAPESVGVFCNSHDELAATAAYFALAGAGGQQNVAYHVFGPPPEYTTNRTPASDLLSALRHRFGDGVVTLTPPITHDERHRAVKYIAKRSGSIMVAPSGAVGFAVAERAHQLWLSQGVPWPAHSLVLLGRPARWGEIERVLKIVEALKLKDRAPASPTMPDGGPLSMDESF